VIFKVLTIVAGLTIVLWSGTPSAHGQKATEIFIPVGQSPGLSGKKTVIGTIATIDARAQTVTVGGPSGSWSATITDRTKIWLDRSKLRLTSQKGTFADFKTGLLAEVKYLDPEATTKGKGTAEWVKIQVAEPSAPSGGQGR